MGHSYVILEERKMVYLYRLEGDKKVKLAGVDLKDTRSPLIKLKSFFEQVPIPLSELHDALDKQKKVIKKDEPNWTSVNLARKI